MVNGNVIRVAQKASGWLDQIRSGNNLPPVDLWRCAVRRGHSGMTQWFIAADQERAELLSSLSRQ